MSSKPLVILFVYNRKEHLGVLIRSLLKNDLGKVRGVKVYCDGGLDSADWKNVEEVRVKVRELHGTLEVEMIEREEHLGLAQSVVSGLNESFEEEEEKLIVLEDDLELSPFFLDFMVKGLSWLRDHEEVLSISGYTYPLVGLNKVSSESLLLPRPSSWGWGTTGSRWKNMNRNLSELSRWADSREGRGKLGLGGGDLSRMARRTLKGEHDSWAVGFALEHFREKRLCLYPKKSLVRNLGWDGSGSHCGVSKEWDVVLGEEEIGEISPENTPDYLLKELGEMFQTDWKHRVSHLLNKLRR